MTASDEVDDAEGEDAEGEPDRPARAEPASSALFRLWLAGTFVVGRHARELVTAGVEID